MKHQSSILNFMLLVGLSMVLPTTLWAAVLSVSNQPLISTASVTPLSMLDITKDQNLYHKAYDDYSDLNGDGVIDTTYNHTIDYYGYFDSYKCYSYASGVFTPVAGSFTGSKPSSCGGNWHGNFLNWVTMTRMDAVRKLLYGGYRSTDTSTNTVLERAFIPTDAHSWAKYYNPDTAKAMDLSTTDASVLSARYPSISALTPFASVPTTPTVISSSTSNTIGTGVKTFDVTGYTTSFSYGDQVRIEDSSNTNNYMIGSVGCVNGASIGMFGTGSCSAGQIKVLVTASAGSGTITSWKISDWTQVGVTFCNTTKDSNTTSQASTAPPLMRAAQGNFSLWSANERWQCLWRDEVPSENTSSLSGATGTQGNEAGYSGLYASSIGPNKTTAADGKIKNALGSVDYTVRVQACVAGSLGNEKCEQYPSGNYKPIGLLQHYGENGSLKFGLMTGSYTKNKSGGVLRKNISNISDEINVATDGTIKTTPPATGSIIQTLNKMRMWGYNYADGTYGKDGTLGNTFCSWGQTSITEGQCLSWGNPMSEIYLESLRYLAGKSASFNATDPAALGLTTATWVDPITQGNYCAPLNVLLFNSASPTYDKDQMGGASDINGANAATSTNTLADQEGINGGSWFVGNNGAGSTPADLCSAKTVSSLASAYGICPEGPGTEGSYLMSGLAYFAHTNKIRTDLTVPASDTKSLKVSTYGIALATNVPKMNINVNGNKVTIMPQGRLDNNGFGSGSIVDFKVVCQIPVGADATTVANVTKISAGLCNAAGSGAFYVNFEDSEQGGDYDQDMWGRIKYQISGSDITVTTDVVAQSTPYKFGFGYAISGTTDKDGPHFTTGINSFDFTDPTTPTVTGDTTHISNGGCHGCAYNDGATSITYSTGGSGGGTLQDPLWYAAKYGGFSDQNGNNRPDLTIEWDNQNSDGSTTGCTTSGCDGVPDNFFQVTNPNYLETALDSVFNAMLKKASSSAVATNSSSLNNGSRIYQARFDTTDWSGQLLSYRISTAGVITATPEWDAGQKINSQAGSGSDSRVVLTKNGVDGVAFNWTNLTSSEQTYLNSTDPSGHECGQDRLNYLRGWSEHEGVGGSFSCSGGSIIAKFRPRATSKLGDIVNSNPWYVGKPSAGYADVDQPGYLNFKTTYAARTPIVYVGANDGMLHGFNAFFNPDNSITTDSGKEVLAYVPTMAYPSLAQLTNSGYLHRFYVDASPMVGDACLSQCTSAASASWASVLIDGMGAGGRGFFALNVTDPASFGASSSATVSSPANQVMWEFNSSDDSDVGLTYNAPPVSLINGQPKQIAKLQNGKWAALLGNGYTTATDGTGHACLYVLYLSGPTGTGGSWQSGTDYVKICADSSSTDNGLSTPTPFDSNGDGLIDTVYAGDIKGNLWKFNLSNMATCASTPSSCVAYGAPLYVAQDSSSNRQPITYAPDVTRYSGGGNMVFFGTGKFIELADKTSVAQQSIYAIQDNGAVVSGRSALNKLLMTTSSGQRTTQVCTASTTPSCTVPTSPKGWYLDLTADGTHPSEFMVGNPKLVNGLLGFNTYAPSSAICNNGTSYLMFVTAISGGSPTYQIFDTNGDGVVNSGDALVSGVEVVANLGGSTFISPTAGSTVGVAVSSPIDSSPDSNPNCTGTDCPPDTTKINIFGGNGGRITWHELLQ